MKIVKTDVKKVVALYRVSTKQQVDKNNIPLQEEACREFAKNKNWEIIKEYYEKGVSGYKNKADNRVEVQKIVRDVLDNKYDVLLLYMYDRLGRLGDDTLDLVKWLLNQGLEIWTVRDGQICNDNLGDKIINLIRFNAAQEESEKSAFRISNRMRQLTVQGFYTGGPVPYGYRKVRKGRLDKKGREIYDLEINEEESEIAKEIFMLYVYKGMGTEKIAQYLNNRGLRSNGGRLFRCNSINRILSNHLMIGYYKRQDIISSHLPELQIVEEDLFKKVQIIKSERAAKRNGDRRNAISSKQLVLLSGNIFCGACGHRMGAFSKHEQKRLSDGSIRQYGYSEYYHCLKKRQYKTCNGPTTYKAKNIDKEIKSFMTAIFSRAEHKNRQLVVEKKFVEQMALLRAVHAEKKKLRDNSRKELQRLHLEVASTLDGQNVFTVEDLKQAIDDQKAFISECELETKELDEEITHEESIYENVRKRYNEFCDWAARFEDMDIDEKRYVVNQLLYKVKLYRNYEMEIELNVEYRRFFEDIEYIR